MNRISKLFLVLLCLQLNAAEVVKQNVKWDLQTLVPAEIEPDNFFPKVLLQTNVGDIVVELDRMRAPITVDNFLAYVVTGSYDYSIFHRVVKSFVVQGGGYNSQYDEMETRTSIFNESGNGLKNDSYSIAMARSDKPHSANRQFYFNLGDNSSLNPGKDWGYAVFGVIVEGKEVVDQIATIPTVYSPELGAEEVPEKPVVILKAKILH